MWWDFFVSLLYELSCIATRPGSSLPLQGGLVRQGDHTGFRKKLLPMNPAVSRSHSTRQNNQTAQDGRKPEVESACVLGTWRENRWRD